MNDYQVFIREDRTIKTKEGGYLLYKIILYSPAKDETIGPIELLEDAKNFFITRIFGASENVFDDAREKWSKWKGASGCVAFTKGKHIPNGFEQINNKLEKNGDHHE